MQPSLLVSPSRSRIPTARRGVVVEDDGSFLSRRLLSLADLIAWRCGWPLSVIARRGIEAPRGLRTPLERRRVESPTQWSTSLSARRHGDLLLVGLPKGWESSTLETHALRAAARASCSVWIERDDLAEQAPHEPKRILVGLGDSEGSTRVVTLAAKLAVSFGAELTVAHVVSGCTWTPSDPGAVEDGDLESSIVSAHSRMATVCQRMRLLEHEPRVVFPVGETAETLISLSSGFDLAVIGRSEDGNHAWEPGSVAARVAADAQCSVLIVQ